MDAKLATLKPPAHPVRTLVWQPRGYTAGPGSLADAVLKAAGLTNISTGGGSGWRRSSVCTRICWCCPLPRYSPRWRPNCSTSRDQGHPAPLVPPALTICAGPWTADAAVMLDR